jgi:pSer/pThr/pTyr-binding forkhead associated (FHA) protein
VSRRHLQLDVNHHDGTATATDLGSTNGTFVNGRATRNALVRHGDGIRIGKTELVLRAEAG